MKKIILYTDNYVESRNLEEVYLGLLALPDEFTTIYSGHREWPLAKGYVFQENPFDGDILILNSVHTNENAKIGNEARARGITVVFIPHAFDSLFDRIENFGRYPTSCFDYILVPAKLEAEVFKQKYGDDRVFCTGMPRLDVLHRMMNDPAPKLKNLPDRYWVVDAVRTELCSENDVIRLYTNITADLPAGHSVVYKVHPGGFASTYTEHYQKDCLLIDDEPDIIYPLLIHAEGVITPVSLMLIEAGILNKPAINWPPIRQEVYAARSSEWMAKELYYIAESGCSFQNIHVTDQQKYLVEQFLHDGKNTERVIMALKIIL